MILAEIESGLETFIPVASILSAIVCPILAHRKGGSTREIVSYVIVGLFCWPIAIALVALMKDKSEGIALLHETQRKATFSKPSKTEHELKSASATEMLNRLNGKKLSDLPENTLVAKYYKTCGCETRENATFCVDCGERL